MAKETVKRDININNAKVIKEICGVFDRNLEVIEKELSIKVLINNGTISLIGQEESVSMGEKLIYNLLEIVDSNRSIDVQDIRYIISMLHSQKNMNIQDLLNDSIGKNARGKSIKPKTWGQKKYIDSLRINDIVFCIGPAGTGKTYLAMAMAVEALRNKKVSRIIITRPAVEAGEHLGFLPGDMQEKVDPYLRPIYDALFEILGVETYNKYMERGIIEIAPLAYMRGRTLESSYVILDEAQNTTNEQMKMLLTRLGAGSKMIITGDVTQVDLKQDRQSGLKTIQKILKGVKGIDFVYLNKKDIVRHQIVQKIIEAYEEYEENL